MGCDLRRRDFSTTFLACLAGLDVFRSGSFSYRVKYQSFMFMHKISTRVVCVNGKHTESFFCPSVRAKRTREGNADTRVTEGTKRERTLQHAYCPTNNEEHWAKCKIP